MNEKYFCYWQLETKEGIACDAHLAEGHVPECPYKRDEIYEDDGRFRIAHRDDKNKLVGRCEDFKLL